MPLPSSKPASLARFFKISDTILSRPIGIKTMRRLYLSALCLPFLLSPAAAMGAKSLSLDVLQTDQPVRELLSQPSKDKGTSFFARQGTSWYRILGCEDGTNGVCLIKASPDASPILPAAEAKALQDGKVAQAAHGDIRKAWLSTPTDRYGHAVLGDAIEAGGLSVQLADGSYRHFNLPSDSVFEDLVPRLADLDGDGRNEVVLVRSYLATGAALTVLGVRQDKLSLLAETPSIGLANRWLNPSIVADLTGDGHLSVGLVRTPHIGGQLQIWQFDGSRLKQISKANGFSNHSIGSRALGLSSVVSHKGSRRIVIPDARQAALLILDGASLKPLARLSLPARPATDFLRLQHPNGKQQILMGLSNGKLYSLTNPKGDLFD